MDLLGGCCSNPVRGDTGQSLCGSDRNDGGDEDEDDEDPSIDDDGGSGDDAISRCYWDFLSSTLYSFTV